MSNRKLTDPTTLYCAQKLTIWSHFFYFFLYWIPMKLQFTDSFPIVDNWFWRCLCCHIVHYVHIQPANGCCRGDCLHLDLSLFIIFFLLSSLQYLATYHVCICIDRGCRILDHSDSTPTFTSGFDRQWDCKQNPICSCLDVSVVINIIELKGNHSLTKTLRHTNYPHLLGSHSAQVSSLCLKVWDWG